jgi:hypothetical protein
MKKKTIKSRKDDVDRASSTHEREREKRNAYEIFVRNTEGTRPLARFEVSTAVTMRNPVFGVVGGAGGGV